MDTQKYNGWTNYATWMVNLHFGNLDFTDDVESGVFDDMDADGIRCHVASLIKELVKSYLDEVAGTDSLFVRDIMNATINDVDWHDIADHYVDDIQDSVHGESQWNRLKELTKSAT
jgi:predicted DNA-binding protein